MTSGFIPPHGGYQDLLSYRKSLIVYDATVYFCKRFLDKRDRTVDQMVQAARSWGRTGANWGHTIIYDHLSATTTASNNAQNPTDYLPPVNIVLCPHRSVWTSKVTYEVSIRYADGILNRGSVILRPSD